MTKKHIKDAYDHSDDFDFFDGNFEVTYGETSSTSGPTRFRQQELSQRQLRGRL